MRKNIKTILALVMAVILVFAFAGCGAKAPEKTPAEEAAESLEATLSALKSADMQAISEIAGGDTFTDSVESLGSEENLQTILKAMFGHFDYKLGEGEQVDDTHVNIPATVSNVDMHKVVKSWYTDLMAYAIANPDIAKDENKDALKDKTVELLTAAVDKTAEEAEATVSSEVVFPMVLEDGKWDIDGTIDSSVLDSILGGFSGAIKELQENNGGK